MITLAVIAIFLVITGGLYLFQEKIIFLSEELRPDYQYNFENSFEEVNYRVDEGISVNALHFTVKNPKGVVFYSHGNAGNLSGWGMISNIILRHGYDLLIYDYRGYGKSGGTISEKNLYHDADFIYRALLDQYDEKQIVVYGRSIGTGIASYIASEHNPKQLILESPYYNLPDLAKKIFPFLPSALLRYKLRNDLFIQDIKCPILIFHGTFDEVIYYESSLKLKEYFKNGDIFVGVESGHHNDLANFKIYHDALKEVLL